MTLNAVIALKLRFFHEIRQIFRPIISQWLKRPIMSVKYCLPVPVVYFWRKLFTHPAARSLCDSGASCMQFSVLAGLRIVWEVMLLRRANNARRTQFFRFWPYSHGVCPCLTRSVALSPNQHGLFLNSFTRWQLSQPNYRSKHEIPLFTSTWEKRTD